MNDQRKGRSSSVPAPKEPWLVAWQRVLRYHDRIVGKANGRSQAECEDDCWAFFVACWHLHEAVALALLPEGSFDSSNPNPEALESKKREVRRILMESSELNVCHDIANSFKHGVLSRPRANRESLKGGPITICPTPIRFEDDGPVGTGWARFEHLIEDEDGNTRSAEECASRAVEEWRRLLRVQWQLLDREHDT